MEGIEVIHEGQRRVPGLVIGVAAFVVLVIVAVALIVSQRGEGAKAPDVAPAVTSQVQYVNRGGYYTRAPSAAQDHYVNRGGYYTLAP
jgi:hypothetical protein